MEDNNLAAAIGEFQVLAIEESASQSPATWRTESGGQALRSGCHRSQRSADELASGIEHERSRHGRHDATELDAENIDAVHATRCSRRITPLYFYSRLAQRGEQARVLAGRSIAVTDIRTDDQAVPSEHIERR